jgi:hypothetical protein
MPAAGAGYNQVLGYGGGLYLIHLRPLDEVKVAVCAVKIDKDFSYWKPG